MCVYSTLQAAADWMSSTPEGFDKAKGIKQAQLMDSATFENTSLIAWHLLKHLHAQYPVSRGEVL